MLETYQKAKKEVLKKDFYSLTTFSIMKALVLVSTLKPEVFLPNYVYFNTPGYSLMQFRHNKIRLVREPFEKSLHAAPIP